MKSLIAVPVLMVLILVNAAPSGAATRLRSIMNELNMNMIRVVDGVMREDYALIEHAAHAIAEHERAPKVERKRIAADLKSRAPEFRAVDVALHDDAAAIAEAASRRDMGAVLKSLMLVQRGCVACHSAFRPGVKRLFYK